MVEERSPCLKCEHLKKSKLECAASCEELEKFKRKLHRCLLTAENSTEYGIPGSERIPRCPTED